MPTPTVERKIHFFLADAGKRQSGRPRTFDPTPALSAIKALPFSDAPHGRYERDEDGNAICLFVSPDHRASVQFCRIRRTGLPLLESAGNLSELPIARDAGLSEATHVRFFPGNIVGAVYNHFGPRISALGTYLYERSRRAIPAVTFRPLLDPAAQRQLDMISDLRILELSVRPSFAVAQNEIDSSLDNALEAISGLFDAPETVSLVLKAPRRGARAFLSRLSASLRNIVRSHSVQENVERLRVRGMNSRTGRVEWMDLLGDHLVSTQEIVQVSRRSRSLDARSACRAIETAYVSMKDDLELASSLSP